MLSDSEIIARFTRIKSGASNNAIFINLTTLDTYFLAKAHKLAAFNHFIYFWNDGRDKQPLRDCIDSFYPPQTCNNPLDEARAIPGFGDLQRFYNIALTIF